MAKYFWIECGLRGAYADGNGYHVKVDTRRELKAIIASEARDIRDAGFVGCSKRAVAWLAAKAWRNIHAERPAYLPYVAEYRRADPGSDYAFGIHCGPSTRRDWKESQDNADW